jgi:glycosyltransferase involved in cell wall biosynthesis
MNEGLTKRPLHQLLYGRRALFISPTEILAPYLHSQGIPHMRQLAGGYGIQFTLLTFERRNWLQAERERALELKQQLKSWDIEWRIHPHVSFPLAPNSTGDLLSALLPTIRLVRERKIEIIHGRSYMPAFMMLLLQRFVSVKFIFDVRGFYPDEMVKSGSWSRHSLAYKISKQLEDLSFRTADAVILVTERQKELLHQKYENKKFKETLLKKLYIVPNCADVSRFKKGLDLRKNIREGFKFEDNIVFLWLVGYIRDVHMPAETLSFFKIAKVFIPSAKLLILTRSLNLSELLEGSGISPNDFRIVNADFEEVPLYTAAADAGMGFVDPNHEDIGIKFAEYLASGLPVITNLCRREWDNLVRDFRLGVVVESFDDRSYAHAAQSLLELLSEGRTLSERCRSMAERYYSLQIAVKNYARVYANVLAQG